MAGVPVDGLNLAFSIIVALVTGAVENSGFFWFRPLGPALRGCGEGGQEFSPSPGT